MRARCIPLFLLLLWPTMAMADSAEAILNKAIGAVLKTSYTGQMRFISQFEHGQMREVKVFHAAPDFYRVEPLSGGSPAGGYFIENQHELLWVSRGTVTMMPQRQFAINDQLTMHFLRELGENPEVTVLDGQVGSRDVYMLRHNGPEVGYQVTVGVDKDTYYPVYLMVNDSHGRARVYYEMASIEFCEPSDLPRVLFSVQGSDRRQLPRPPQSGSEIVSSSPTLPLYPGWLPASYRIGAVNLLRCPRDKAEDCELVYQLEAYGPRITDMISIFQMHADDADDSLIRRLNIRPDAGYVVTKKGPWIVAVFGDMQQEDLAKVAKHLTRSDDRVRNLLAETNALERIMNEALRSER